VDEGVRTRKGRGGSNPSGSAEPISALLGLDFSLRALVGLRVSGQGAPPILRSEDSGKCIVGLWAYSFPCLSSTLLKSLYILLAQNGGLTWMENVVAPSC
jgi:hypothetical protein